MTQDLTLRIVRALEYHRDRRWNYPAVMYPYNTLYFVLGGDGHIRLGDNIIDLQPGFVYLIPPHVCHDVWCDTHVDKMYADVHAELLPGYDVFSGTNSVLSRHVGLDFCRRMCHLCQDGLRNRLTLQGELALIMADFLDNEPKHISAKMLTFLPLVTYIQQHLSAQLRRDQIAAHFGWNPSSLSRAFKQAFDCTLKQYIEKLLTARLAQELISTSKTLQQLASEYQFCDEYYLSAFFKRNLGLSPQKYRSNYSSQW